MKNRGLILVLEGSDGSGKATQLKLLSERLKAAGYDVSTFDFPRYNKESSHFIKTYLSGGYGSAKNISPYTASLFYALDRYEASNDILKEVEAGKIVLIDRYVGSNMAHQGAKFDDPVEQRGFFVWEDNLEYQLLNIPRPNINLFLRVPADISNDLISQRSGQNKARDEHESNLEFLRKSVATYDLLCELFPKDFSAIECTENGKLLSVATISNLIWDKLKPLLPPDKPHLGHSSVVTLSSPTQSSPQIDDHSPKLIQQFTNSSLLLKLNVERQIKSVEPSGFSVWSDFDYKFYTPMGLPKEVDLAYKDSLFQIAKLHKQMRQKLEQHYEKSILTGQMLYEKNNISQLLLPVTPLAALSNFSVKLSDKAVNRLSTSLLSSDTPELQWSAKQLYTAAKAKWPRQFKQPIESQTGPEPINNIIAKLAEDKLSLNSSDKKEVRLLEASPRLEFDLLAESIYPYSNLSLEEISEEVSAWSYQQKLDSFKQAAAAESVLEKIKYKFDVVSDQISLNDFNNLAVISNLQVQMASPRFGYEVDPILEDIGIEELYLECFDISLKLFSILQQIDRDDLTVYATLLGHRMRWQFSVDAKNLNLILKQGLTVGNKNLIDGLMEAVAEVHPLTWEVLSEGNLQAQNRLEPRNRIKPAKRRHKPKKTENI